MNILQAKQLLALRFGSPMEPKMESDFRCSGDNSGVFADNSIIGSSGLRDNT